MSPMHRTASAVATVVLAVSIAGCGGSSSRSTTPASGSTTPDSSLTSTLSPTPTASASPTVAPATGPTLSSKGVSVRLPDGWKVDPAETSIQVDGVDSALDHVYVALFPTIGNGTEGVAKSVRKTFQLPASAVRPEETFDGQPFAHLSNISSGGGIYSDIYATALPIDGQTMLVSIAYANDHDAATLTTDDVDAIMQPVMATLELP